MMRRRSALLIATVVVGAVVAAIAACGGGDFDPQSKVDSVRIFGVRADKPYAKPGETVTLEVLATDARKTKPRPLRIFWIPVVCLNPREDLYYLCFLPPGAPVGGRGDAGTRLIPPFPADGGAADAGTGGLGDNPLSRIPTGIDLGPFLPQGPTFGFQMPDDAIVRREGTGPYGLAIVFNIACAGQVRLAERNGNNPQQVPIQCTDEEGVPLSPNDYVIGINRVYSYADIPNTNPTVEKVTRDGLDVDLAQGITVERCLAQKRIDCPAIKIDVKIPEASAEPNPTSSEGAREQVWATYYSDVGFFKDDARLIYDAKSGRVSESDIEYRAPKEPGDGTIWAVVHDNRAGAAFVVFPVHVK